MSIALGWRFSPTKVETITILYYLSNGISLPGVEVVIGHDVFGDLTPTELFQATANIDDDDDDDDNIVRYFYTIKTLKKNGKNFKRTVEKLNESSGKLERVGTWKAGTAPDRIYDPKTGSLIGESRFYTFVGLDDDDWLMTAFSLAGDCVRDKDPNSDLFSICKIYKKAPKKPDNTLPASSSNNQQQQSESINSHPAVESEVEKNTNIEEAMPSNCVYSYQDPSSCLYPVQSESINNNLEIQSEIENRQFDNDSEKTEAVPSNYDYSYADLSYYLSPPVQSNWSYST